MQRDRRAGDLPDFCLVLTPTLTAAERAREAIRRRFAFLADENSSEVTAVVANLVQSSVERRPRTPITVTIAVDTEVIRGEVSDNDELVPFEIPLVSPA